MTICKECEHEKSRQKREHKKNLLIELKEVGCCVCGETDPICLDFHHYDQSEKEFNISQALTKSVKDMLLEAAEQERKEIPPILATDLSPEAIQNAQINAHAAGVFSHITFAACDFADTDVSPFAVNRQEEESTANSVAARPAVFFNPEYGIRLGDPEELKVLYDRIGQFLAEKCHGMTGALITGNPDLAREVNLKYKHRVPFYNGPIDCRLFLYEL
jgi:23S rRNA G2445 N2-methylase RlmL